MPTDDCSIFPPEKICRSCQQSKALHFFTKDKSKRGGTNTQCLECHQQEEALRRASRPAKPKVISLKTRLRQLHDRLQRWRKTNQKIITRHREEKRKKREEVQRRQRFIENPESVREKRRKAAALLRQRDPERVRATLKRCLQKRHQERPEQERAIHQAKKAKKPELYKAIRQTAVERRRARTLNDPLNDFTHKQWLEIQIAQNHRCCYCGKRRKGKLTQDHITPFSRGGSHTLHNIIGACLSCNSKKNAGKPPIPVQPFLLTVAPAKKKAS